MTQHPRRQQATRRYPVARYYLARKRRYLVDPATAANMVTGTPFDWEDAAGYASEIRVDRD